MSNFMLGFFVGAVAVLAAKIRAAYVPAMSITAEDPVGPSVDMFDQFYDFFSELDDGEAWDGSE